MESDKHDGIDTGSDSTRSSSSQSPAFTSRDSTAATDDRTGVHAVLDDRTGQATSGSHQSTSSSTSSGSGHTPSSNAASQADSSTVKLTASDLSQSKASHASTGDGDTLSVTAASTGDSHGLKAGPAHDWSSGEIAWAVEFARQAVGSMVTGGVHAVDGGHGGTLKQAGTDSTQAFSSWSGKAGSDGDPAWANGSTSDHSGKISLTSTSTIDHVATEHAQTIDLHQGYGLTGFEV